MASLNAMRQLNTVTTSKKKSTEKLSSGYKINRAADDAAGLTISEKMRSLIRGLNQGADNIQDGVSLMQIADGALAEVHDMLHRANELAVKSANGTNTDADREAIQAEVDQILDEVDRIGASTTFNTMHIFDRETIEAAVGPISKLVTSPSAETGFLSEAYQTNSGYYPAASMDFSHVNSSNIDSLNGAYFSFTCTAGCGESFKISFVTGEDGTKSTGPTNPNTSSAHNYVIDISNCTSGTDLINTAMNYITEHPARTSGAASIGEGIGVSHSNVLVGKFRMSIVS